MRPRAEIFLHPPQNGIDDALSRDTRRLLKTATDAISNVFATPTPHRVRSALLAQEARSSSAIEGVHEEKAVQLHHLGLLAFTSAPYSKTSLLVLHGAVMSNQPHAQPGQYRTVNAQVGNHIAPPWQQVPALMQELNAYIEAAGTTPSIKQAAWAHIEFETIHPFADGNGRTGRAVINRMLNAPLPLSDYILKNRHRYYELLGASEWEPYLRWFAQGIIQECIAIDPR